MRKGISNAWVETEVTTTAKDKSAVGVYAREWTSGSVLGEDAHVYNALGFGHGFLARQFVVSRVSAAIFRSCYTSCEYRV